MQNYIGSIDIDALAKLVDFFLKKDTQSCMVIYYGTTLKCACDDVKRAEEVLVTI